MCIRDSHYVEYNGIGNSYVECITEHYKFFMMETFIWTNIILFKYKKYFIMHDILYSCLLYTSLQQLL